MGKKQTSAAQVCAAAEKNATKTMTKKTKSVSKTKDKEDKDSVNDKRQRQVQWWQKNTYKDKIETRTLFSSGLQLKTRSKWSLGFSDYSSSGSDIEISHSIPFKIEISHFIKVHRKKREIIKTLQNWRRHSSNAWHGLRFSPFTFTSFELQASSYKQAARIPTHLNSQPEK